MREYEIRIGVINEIGVLVRILNKGSRLMPKMQESFGFSVRPDKHNGYFFVSSAS
jgi:hypothetical protein